MTKIGVQILKTHNRFQLTCPYNKKLLKVIRKIKKRYYSRINKTWYLPLEEYPAFKDFLSEDPEFEFEVKESKPVVFIKSIGDKIEVKFSKFIEEFKKYLEFDGRRYNASERKITMPKEHLEAVISLSNEFGFEIVITDEILVD